jgi:hypothetical protein
VGFGLIWTTEIDLIACARPQVVGTPVAPQSESLRGCGDFNALDAHIHRRTAVLLSHVEETLVPSVFLDRNRIDAGIDFPPVTWRLPNGGPKWMKLLSAE